MYIRERFFLLLGSDGVFGPGNCDTWHQAHRMQLCPSNFSSTLIQKHYKKVFIQRVISHEANHPATMWIRTFKILIWSKKTTGVKLHMALMREKMQSPEALWMTVRIKAIVKYKTIGLKMLIMYTETIYFTFLQNMHIYMEIFKQFQSIGRLLHNSHCFPGVREH